MMKFDIFFPFFSFFLFPWGGWGEERREGGRERRRMAPPNSLVLQVGPVLLTDDIHSGSYDYELKTFDLLKNGWTTWSGRKCSWIGTYRTSVSQESHLVIEVVVHITQTYTWFSNCLFLFFQFFDLFIFIYFCYSVHLPRTLTGFP